MHQEMNKNLKIQAKISTAQNEHHEAYIKTHSTLNIHQEDAGKSQKAFLSLKL